MRSKKKKTMVVGTDKPRTRNPEVWRPMEDKCKIHGKGIWVPIEVTEDGVGSLIWICAGCVAAKYYNEAIQAQVQLNWPNELAQSKPVNG